MSIALLALSTFVATLAPAQTAYGAVGGTAIGDPTTATPLTHQLVFFQGEDPETTPVEPTSLVQVLERSVWRVPWNETVLYTPVPAGANEVWLDNVESFSHAGFTVFGAGPYSASKNPLDPPLTGRVPSGPYVGMYYWRFPSMANRTVPAVLNPFTEGALNEFDPALTTAGAWAIGPQSLGLRPGVPAANYTGFVVPLGIDITSVNVSWSGHRIDSNLSVLISADGGATWKEVSNGTPAPMDGPGAALRWRVSMSQDVALNRTPVLTNMSVDVRYLPEDNEVWLQLEYTLELEDGALDFSVDYLVDGDQTALIFLGYFDPHIELRVEGMEVTLTNVAGKVTYRHMQGDYGKDLAFKVRTIDTSVRGSTMIWLGLGLVIIGAVVVAYIWSRGRHPAGMGVGSDVGAGRPAGDEDEGGAGDEGEGDEAGEDDAEAASNLEDLSIDELRSMKKDILRAIKRADKELEDGIIGEEQHAAIRATYKRRAVQVMRAIEAKGR